MILIIAEKPSLGRDIADSLPGEYGKSEPRRYIVKGNYIITWVFGHMLTLKEPEDYDIKYKKWNLDDLPIYFQDWGCKIGKSSAGFEPKEERVKMIGELIEKSEYVIHAGDPDEEGQLLIDELLQWFGCKKNVMRLDTGDTTRAGLIKAFSRMKDNSLCINEGRSAYARSVADMMVGVNMSRYFTCTNNGVLLTVGRVQTPTLGLVVARDLAIEGHIKQIYYDVYVDVDINTAEGIKRVRTKFRKKKIGKNSDETSGFQTIEESKKLLESLKGRTFDNIKISRKTVKEPAPLPFNLVKLQSYCSSHFGYNPKEVMDITQSLREKYKAITYNRSDCQYLTEEHFKEAPKTMDQVVRNINYRPSLMDMSIHSRCFNDKNITAHFAIIPTNNQVDLKRLSERERNVYLAVCKYYMAQFMPHAIKEKSALNIDLDASTELYAHSGKVISPGYLEIFRDIKREVPTKLSEIPQGVYSGNTVDGAVEEKETKPPSRYTKATLNEDMTRIAKYVTDEEIKKLLELKDADKKGENGSIGTSATRSTIIDGLVEKGYIEEKGKKLISTPLGRELYRILPDEIKKADMTARWWSIQEDIRTGKSGSDALTSSVLETINNIIGKEYPKINQTIMTKNVTEKFRNVLGKCPLCGGNVIEGSKGFGCSNWQPPTSCKFVVWKTQKNGMFKNTTITETMMKKLLTGKSVRMKKLTSNSGESFEADVVLKADKDAQYPVRLEFAPPQSLGKCPKCGGDVKESMKAYSCECGFIIWKKMKGMFSKTNISPNYIKKWLAGQEIECKNLVNRKGEKFSAFVKLKFNPENSYGGAEFELSYKGQSENDANSK